jgi:hypothetical protein
MPAVLEITRIKFKLSIIEIFKSCSFVFQKDLEKLSSQE